MFFEFQFLSPGDGWMTNFVDKQAIMCLFGDSTTYGWEAILNHDALFMQELRAANKESTYQRVLDKYEELRRQPVTKEEILIRLIAKDLESQYPNISNAGFELGLLILPREGESRLLNGGRLIFGIFPQETSEESSGLGWPMMAAPCMMEFPIGEDDPSVFWGLVGAGIAECIRKNDITVLVDMTQQTADQRRKESLRSILEAMNPAPFFVGISEKHVFLNHAFNLLITYANSRLGVQEVRRVQLSSETEITRNSDDSITWRPKTLMIVR